MCPGHGWCRYGGPSTGPGRPSSGRTIGVRYPLAVGTGVRAWGPSTVPLACMPCGGLRAAGVVGGRPLGAGLPPVPGASGLRPCPSLGLPSLGAGSQDPLPVCPGHMWCGYGQISTGPAARALVSRRCALSGWREGVPGEGCLAPL